MKKYGSHAADPPKGMFCEINFPVMLRLDEWTPDGRRIESAGFSSRELPLSVMAMFKTGYGHEGAENAGSIDEVTVNDDGSVSGKGWLLNEEVGFAVARRVQSGALRGNSVDLVAEDYTLEIDERGDMKMSIVKSKLGGTTVCPVPAFEGAYAEIPDGVEVPEASEAVLAALDDDLLIGAFANRHTFEFTETAVKVKDEKPPADAFAKPEFTGIRPLEVTEDLRVSGYIAGWDSTHLSTGVAVPRSRTDYAYFLNGNVLTDAGMVPTGRLVIGGQHAAEDAFWTEAIDFYATTSRAWADVFCGEDEYGIWVAGMVRPGTSDQDVYAARASDNSGDWRPIGGSLELIVSLSVNAGAFPKPRVRAFSRGGVQLSLTGAGMLHRSDVRPQHGNVLAMSSNTKQALDYIAHRMAAEEAREIAAALAAEDD